MSVTSPVADMLTRIRNSLMVKHSEIVIPHSRLKENILTVMKKEGFILDYMVIDKKPQKDMKIFLKYDNKGCSVIRGLEMVSKPGRRAYSSKDDVPKVLNGLGVSLISTSMGILTDSDCKKKAVGGEVICKIW